MSTYNWMQVLGILFMVIAQITLGWGGAPSSICVMVGFLAAWLPLGLLYNFVK